jgi:signal transduction histidine kinase
MPPLRRAPSLDASQRWSIVAPMSATAATRDPFEPRVLGPVFSWPRVRFTLWVAGIFGLFFSTHRGLFIPTGIFRTCVAALFLMMMFGVFERWPRKLPRWLARSALQVVGTAVLAPIAAGFGYVLSWAIGTQGKAGLDGLTAGLLIIAPWIAVGALLKQRGMFAREQALAFELERSELERRALDARLRVLQAQVEPHFLFNTLANVRALVDSGSPQASRVLSSLIAYLRAAVPRMDERASTLEREMELVRAYLEIMQMRMPDRLKFALHVDPAANALPCPPMTLLTLVENAVRHGIDPTEAGGRIDVDVWMRDGRCVIRVTDTGVGLGSASRGLGTGLTNLRERLQLAFGGEATLSLTSIEPHGTCAEIQLPLRRENA